LDGNEISALRTAFGHVAFEKGRPNLVLARTTKGKGISSMENVPGWHHRVPTEDELAQAMSELEAAGENLNR
jgi:transketolase